MIEVGTRVIVPPYTVPNDLTHEVLDAELQERVGTVDKIMDDGNMAPGRRPQWCFVVLDDALGNNDVRQCRADQLIEIEPGAEFYEKPVFAEDG
jgi:hypothetical protein